MKTSIISACPGCGKNLEATKLSCKACNIDIAGEFALSKFDMLTPDELQFIESFLASMGSFKALQAERKLSYPVIRKRYVDILAKLELAPSNPAEAARAAKPKRQSKAPGGEPKRRGRPKKES